MCHDVGDDAVTKRKADDGDRGKRKKGTNEPPEPPPAAAPEPPIPARPYISVKLNGAARHVYLVGKEEAERLDPDGDAYVRLDLTRASLPDPTSEPGKPPRFRQKDLAALRVISDQVQEFKLELQGSPDKDGLIFCMAGKERTPSAAGMLIRQCSETPLEANSLLTQLQVAYDSAGRQWEPHFKERARLCLLHDVGE